MGIIEHAISAPCEGVLVEPVGGGRVGVLVLAGSSGYADTGPAHTGDSAGTGV